MQFCCDKVEVPLLEKGIRKALIHFLNLKLKKQLRAAALLSLLHFLIT